MICVVLSNPYEAQDFFNQIVKELALGHKEALALFFIDKKKFESFVESLADKGWMGSSPFEELKNSLIEGMKNLARTILEELRAQADKMGVKLYTELLLGTAEDLERTVSEAGCSKVLKQPSEWPFAEG